MITENKDHFLTEKKETLQNRILQILLIESPLTVMHFL